jgi:hypothetical protein
MATDPAKVVDQLGKTVIQKAKKMREETEGLSPEQLIAVGQFVNSYRKLLELHRKVIEAEDPFLNGRPTD